MFFCLLRYSMLIQGIVFVFVLRAFALGLISTMSLDVRKDILPVMSDWLMLHLSPHEGHQKGCKLNIKIIC